MLVLTFQVRSRAQRFQKLVDHSAFHCHIGQCTGLLTIVLTIEATPDSTSRPLRIRVCQSRRDRTGLSSLRNCDKANVRSPMQGLEEVLPQLKSRDTRQAEIDHRVEGVQHESVPTQRREEVFTHLHEQSPQ